MITLIHGIDTVSSRKILDAEKEKRHEDEIVIFEGNNLDITALLTADQSQSLFVNKKTIIIENLLSTTISDQKGKLISYLSSKELVSDVIIWEKNEIDKTSIKKYLPRAKEIACQPPLLLFKFLDTIFENPSASLSLFHTLLSQRDAELVYSMLVRQFRTLIIAKDMGAGGLTAMQRWQAEKFVRQSNRYDTDKLISLYRQLLSIDYSVKSGQTPYKMTELLDIFILNL